MIRLARPDEYADLVDIWLEASLQAHDFIPDAFWHSQRDAMLNHYLPAAETGLWKRTARCVASCPGSSTTSLHSSSTPTTSAADSAVACWTAPRRCITHWN